MFEITTHHSNTFITRTHAPTTKVTLQTSNSVISTARIISTILNHEHVSSVLRFPPSMNDSIIILKLYYRNCHVEPKYRSVLEQTKMVHLSSQQASLPIYVNSLTIHSPYKSEYNLQIQYISQKSQDTIVKVVLPVTQKLFTCKYQIQFRKQMKFC